VPPVALRPRSVPEIIDASVSLLRQHYLELVTANALFTVPLLIVTLMTPLPPALQGSMQSSPLAMAAQFSATTQKILPWYGLMVLVALILGPLANATTVAIVTDNYLGREVTIGAAVERALSRFFAVLVAGLLQGFLIGLGFICIIIPGFFCIAWFFSVVNVVIAEGRGPIAALGRSHFLAKGSVVRILSTMVLCLVILLIIGAVVNGVALFLVGLLHTSPRLVTLVGTLVRIFTYPFFTVVATVLYFDLRIRKEGMDLDIMAKELGVGTPVTLPA
jgi:hypothetical protein